MMRKRELTVIALFVCIINIGAQEVQDVMRHFLHGVITINATTLDAESPIAGIKSLAMEQAELSIKFNKTSIKEVLTMAKKYKACIITVGAHTITRIVDLKDCIDSGTWRTCMPMGEGYIQNDGLTYKHDYLNNIIGIPDAQERMAYFFMKK